MTSRVAFITIGQSPRVDLVPDICAHARTGLDVFERGALDDLGDAEISALAPAEGEARLVTRLRDGREVIVAKAAIKRRLASIFADLDGAGFDLLVLLCTGRIGDFSTRTPLLAAQSAVDHFVQGVAGNARSVGVVLPSAEQISQFHGLGNLACTVVSASPFSSGDEEQIREAAGALKDADVIVLHCMGFTEPMRAAVRAVSGKPVLLPRQLLAHAIDIILS